MGQEFICLAAVMLLCCGGVASLSAQEDVSVESLGYDGSGERLMFNTHGFSNSGDCTTVRFSIECQDVPFRIDSLQLVVCDTVYSTLTPFRFGADGKEVRRRRQLWLMSVRFPQLFSFSDEDKLVVYSTRGKFEMPVSLSAKNREEADRLSEEVTALHYTGSTQRGVMWISVAIAVVSILGAAVWNVVCRRRYRRKAVALAADAAATRKKREDESKALAEERKLLMRSRFTVFNSLCNEYFEKGDSELTRATLVGDIEKVLRSYRSLGMLKELKTAVNANMDGILSRAAEQIPSLTESDLQFLTYLYAGFSPRAVCLMTDSKLKNFYNRRTRLKERILASGARDAAWFADEMQPSGA